MNSKINVEAGAFAIVGWEEGAAGLVHSWHRDAGLGPVACFIHPSDTPPKIDAAVVRSEKESPLFEPPVSDSYKGLPLVSATDWPAALKEIGLTRALITLSDPGMRFQALEQALAASLDLVNAVHPTATVLAEAELGHNVILHAGAIVGYRARIGDGAIINTGAQIDHHGVVGECVNVDPGAVLAGNVTLRSRCTVHSGATIINNIVVGEDAVIGAGSVVIRDVQPATTVIGVPARARPAKN